MSVKTINEQLRSFMKRNKVARLQFAKKHGFTSWENYRDHLKSQTGSTTPTTDDDAPLTIHLVDILDCSGSMSSKLPGALEAINKQVEIHQEEEGINYTYTLCHFSYSNDIKYTNVQSPIHSVEKINFNTRGMTALYDAIGDTCNKIEYKKEEKVLVNIYTDGRENGSRRYDQSGVRNLIKNFQEKGWTITFVGTDTDVDSMVRHFHVHESNTLKYDGSAEGLKKAMDATSVSRAAYSAKAVAGEDVSKGFYKTLVNK